MIKIENLTKTFDSYAALNNISCTIDDGCIYGMIGSNGAGKSTFLRLVTGVYKPDKGSITIDGNTIWDNPITKKRMAYVPDELYFLPGSTLNKMKELYKNTMWNFDEKRFDGFLHTFSLDPTKQISTFSKGMKRQAATILAISTNPDYIFFDETFDGLDPVMRNYVKSIICQDVLDRGATAVITSHSLRELEDTCNQLALLHKGGLIFESDISDLKTKQFKIQIAFSDDFSQDSFAGLEIMNFIKHGSVANMIVKGNRDEVTAKLKQMNPLLLDILPLTLEEVFTYELSALGYSFDCQL